MRLVWYPNGVMKLAEAASMMQKAMFINETFPCSAASIATGKMSAAAALFVTTLLMSTVARYTIANNPVLPNPKFVPTLTKNDAMAEATPLFTMAVPMPNAEAMVTKISQLTY